MRNMIPFPGTSRLETRLHVLAGGSLALLACTPVPALLWPDSSQRGANILRMPLVAGWMTVECMRELYHAINYEPWIQLSNLDVANYTYWQPTYSCQYPAYSYPYLAMKAKTVPHERSGNVR